MAVARIIRRPLGPFAFPCTKPGFDPSHPLSRGIAPGHGLSTVALGTANLVNLLNGQVGTRVGSPTAGVTSSLGHTINLSASGMEIDFSGNYNAATEPMVTFAAVFQLNSLPGATSVIVSNNNIGTSNGGASIGFNASNQLQITVWGATARAATSIGAVSANVPYFAAMSGNSSATAFVLRRLDTGAVLTDSQLGYVPHASLNTATYSVGGSNNLRPLLGKFAAGMWSPAFNPLPSLVAASADPWSFWYPK